MSTFLVHSPSKPIWSWCRSSYFECNDMSSSFHIVCWEGIKLVLGEHFKDRLHDHSFSNIIFYMTFDSHCACLRSCVGTGMGAWLFACLVIPFFHLASNAFSFALRIRVGLPHPLAIKVTHCICGRPLDHGKTHFFRWSHVGERVASRNMVWNAFVSIVRDMGFRVLHEQTHVLPPLSL